MKRLFVLLLCTPFAVQCQPDLFNTVRNIGSTNTGVIEAQNISGKPIPVIEAGRGAPITGSPMITDEFTNGIVTLEGNPMEYNLLVNFSLFDNELYFKKGNEILKFANKVEKFSLITKNKDVAKVLNFKKGFPTIGHNTENTFYQILLDGSSLQLVKHSCKTINEKYNYGGPSEQEYSLQNTWYVYDVAGKTFLEIKLSVNSLEKALPNYAASIEKFAVQNKIKNEEDLITIIAAINNEPTKKELKAVK